MRSAIIKVSILTLAGGALPLLFSDSVPQKFNAEVRLKVDASESAVNDAAALLRSKANLDNLVRALNLGAGSEFAVDRPTAVRVVSDIVSGQEMTVTQAESRLRERLSQAIAVTYDRTARQAVISVAAARADEAAQIANMLGDTFRDEVVLSGAGASQPVVEKLRQTLEHAEAALSGFMAETDEHKLAELRRSEEEDQQRTIEIAEAEAQLTELRQKSAQASALKLADVLAKPLPDSLEYTGLDYQRQRHVEAKLLVDQLSGNLGPRHPKLLAAQAALEDVRNDIQDALKQLVTSLRQQEGAAAKRLAEIKAKQRAKPDDKEIADSAARLKMLEAAVGEARENYLEALHRADTGPKTSAVKVDIVAPATAAGAQPVGPSFVEISGGGAMIGFFLGAALAFFTRRKPLREPEINEIEHAADGPEALAPHWQEGFSEQAGEFGDRHEPARYEPIYDEDDYRRQQPLQARYPAPANDTPFGDHIRDMLMANRRPAQDAGLPPLVAAVISGRVSQTPAYAVPHVSEEEKRRAEEVRQLRRHMAELRERIEVYSASRSNGRR
ncbi:GumC domain-containing protein [Rhizobium terrae]|uniref:hypothetical protein n=1 Tax=Rhizobium terrae TaxID=2171756 RepID=UPI0013C2C2D5|nr:hypothetical protein [Rhizobium terrae]